METMQTEQYAPRPYRFWRYDRRLILKVVQEVEEGLPRKEAIRIYGLVPSIIRAWMRTYGSTHYLQHLKRNSYSNLKKRIIVSADEQGRMSVSEAQVTYKVRAAKTIRDWVYFATTSPNWDVTFYFSKIYIRNVRQGQRRCWEENLQPPLKNFLKHLRNKMILREPSSETNDLHQ